MIKAAMTVFAAILFLARPDSAINLNPLRRRQGSHRSGKDRSSGDIATDTKA